MSSHDLLPGETRPISVRREKWVRSLPAGCWPESFAEGDLVSRSEVFSVAEQWRRGEVSSRVFVGAVLAWGYGTTGYGCWRATRTLEADPEGARLQTMLEPLRAPTISLSELQEVYSRFFARPRLPWLGPAYFTKLIYFAGYRRTVGGVQPLILDRTVAERLPLSVGVRRWTWNWSCEEWTHYLEWAAKRPPTERDEVEMALFEGRAVP